MAKPVEDFIKTQVEICMHLVNDIFVEYRNIHHKQSGARLYA